MAFKLFICLSFVALVLAEDISLDESTKNVVDSCVAEQNVSEDEVHKFGKREMEATPEMKDFFLCVTQNLGVFDGVNWNVEAIKKVVKDEEKMKDVAECLEKDDKTQEPKERSIRVVSCCLEKEAFF